MIVVKTGMSIEQQIASQFSAPGTPVLTGTATPQELDTLVAKDCTGILSFGLCGGLSPEAIVGQAFIYDRCVTPDEILIADSSWRQRLFTATKYYERGCFSNGQLNTANTIEQRKALFEQYGCWIIDDETYSVALFAKMRSIPWIGLRVVSDGAEDTLPPAVVNALNTDGSTNIWAVVESVASDPSQIPALIQTTVEYNKSVAELRTAALQAGKNWSAV